jgi:hypothetical protein
MERWSATRQIGGVFSKVDPFSSFARSLNEETKINQDKTRRGLSK